MIGHEHFDVALVRPHLGLGHIETTALPGESGNIAIAGHRDTFFRPLRNVKIGDDEIEVKDEPEPSKAPTPTPTPKKP